MRLSIVRCFDALHTLLLAPREGGEAGGSAGRVSSHRIKAGPLSSPWAAGYTFGPEMPHELRPDTLPLHRGRLAPRGRCVIFGLHISHFLVLSLQDWDWGHGPELSDDLLQVRRRPSGQGRRCKGLSQEYCGGRVPCGRCPDTWVEPSLSWIVARRGGLVLVPVLPGLPARDAHVLKAARLRPLGHVAWCMPFARHLRRVPGARSLFAPAWRDTES